MNLVLRMSSIIPKTTRPCTPIEARLIFGMFFLYNTPIGMAQEFAVCNPVIETVVGQP